MGIVSEFRDFAIKGNMLDMAVGIVIGAAFTSIITSLVEDMLMPIVGYVSGGVDFSKMGINLGAGVDGGEPVVIGYGKFINALIAFLIVAFVLFMIIKAVNRAKEAAGLVEESGGPPADQVLLEEIRDELRKRPV